jgi:hypothetical protein
LAFATLVEYAVIVVVAIDVIRAAFLADQFSAFWAPIQRGTIAVTEKAFQFGPLLAHFVCSDWLSAFEFALNASLLMSQSAGVFTASKTLSIRLRRLTERNLEEGFDRVLDVAGELMHLRLGELLVRVTSAEVAR